MNIRDQLNSAIYESVNNVMRMLKVAFKKELEAQGHVNTGKLLNSIEFEINLTATAVVGIMYHEEYGQQIETGVPAQNIKYSPGSGAASSKYITGLIKYFRSKGLSFKAAKRASFATANKHKQEGMPTRKSFRFSSNGRRTGYITHTVNDRMETIEKIMQDPKDYQQIFVNLAAAFSEVA